MNDYNYFSNRSEYDDCSTKCFDVSFPNLVCVGRQAFKPRRRSSRFHRPNRVWHEFLHLHRVTSVVHKYSEVCLPYYSPIQVKVCSVNAVRKEVFSGDSHKVRGHHNDDAHLIF